MCDGMIYTAYMINEREMEKKIIIFDGRNDS